MCKARQHARGQAAPAAGRPRGAPSGSSTASGCDHAHGWAPPSSWSATSWISGPDSLRGGGGEGGRRGESGWWAAPVAAAARAAPAATQSKSPVLRGGRAGPRWVVVWALNGDLAGGGAAVRLQAAGAAANSEQRPPARRAVRLSGRKRRGLGRALQVAPAPGLPARPLWRGGAARRRVEHAGRPGAPGAAARARPPARRSGRRTGRRPQTGKRAGGAGAVRRGRHARAGALLLSSAGSGVAGWRWGVRQEWRRGRGRPGKAAARRPVTASLGRWRWRKPPAPCSAERRCAVRCTLAAAGSAQAAGGCSRD